MHFGRTAGFAATALALGVGMMGTTLPTPLYALYRQRFGFSELMITVIFAAYAGGVIAALLLLGRLSDQIGRRRMLLPALGFSALSACVFLLADGLPLLLAGRIVSGFSAGIFTGTATATLVDLAPPERRGRATLGAAVANMGCAQLDLRLPRSWRRSPRSRSRCLRGPAAVELVRRTLPSSLRRAACPASQPHMTA